MAVCSRLRQKIVERNSTVPCKKSQATTTRTLGGPAQPLPMLLSSEGTNIHSRSSLPVTHSFFLGPYLMPLLSFFDSPVGSMGPADPIRNLTQAINSRKIVNVKSISQI
jgi:hypothetical protein